MSALAISHNLPEMVPFVDNDHGGSKEQHNGVRTIVGETYLFRITALHAPLH
jgi:hypothetical protein